jgi:hypothetical protein
LALAAFLGAVGCNEGTGTSSKKPGTGGNVPATTKETVKETHKEAPKETKKETTKKADKAPEKPSK